MHAHAASVARLRTWSDVKLPSAGGLGQPGQYRGGAGDLLSRLQGTHLSQPAPDTLAGLMGALQMRHEPQPQAAGLAALAQGLHQQPPFQPPPQPVRDNFTIDAQSRALSSESRSRKCLVILHDLRGRSASV